MSPHLALSMPLLQASLQCLHRDAAYWTDPHVFLPERFLEGSPVYRVSELAAFMPWGEVREGRLLCASQACFPFIS
jgi:cytochrome P450